MVNVAIQAHRGSPDPIAGIVENSLEAFVRARRLGADGVELDVRLTADGALAVHHDPIVTGLGPVTELRTDDLPGHVPLLGAVLRACEGMTVNIEIKNLPTEPNHDPGELAAREVGKLVAELGAVDRVIVSSFWMASLDAVRHTLPEIATGLLVASWFDPGVALAMARRHGCTAVHPHATLVTPTLMEEAHGTGLAVTPWTVNDRASLEAMAALGVDTVITDDVGLATTTLRGG